jgi:hypothetical protein
VVFKYHLLLEESHLARSFGRSQEEIPKTQSYEVLFNIEQVSGGGTLTGQSSGV